MPNRAWEHFHESSNHDSWTALGVTGLLTETPLVYSTVATGMRVLSWSQMCRPCQWRPRRNKSCFSPRDLGRNAENKFCARQKGFHVTAPVEPLFRLKNANGRHRVRQYSVALQVSGFVCGEYEDLGDQVTRSTT